jgi:hypothetical protein
VAERYTFSIGEAYDDLIPVFVIDGRDYPDEEAMRADLAAADQELARLKIISEREATRVEADAPRSRLPTWRDWFTRHIVLQKPIGVRPRPATVTVPPGWEAMGTWLDQIHTWLRDLLLALGRSVPGGSAEIDFDPGPQRQGRGSVDWAEERYGVLVGVTLTLPRNDEETVRAALHVLGEWLTENGWTVGRDRGLRLSAGLSGHEISAGCHHGHRVVLLSARSRVVGAPDFAP